MIASRRTASQIVDSLAVKVVNFARKSVTGDSVSRNYTFENQKHLKGLK